LDNISVLVGDHVDEEDEVVWLSCSSENLFLFKTLFFKRCSFFLLSSSFMCL